MEYGPAALCLRLDDKLSRVKQILLNGQSGTPDESVIDTLMDLADYAVMGIMEILPSFEKGTPENPIVEDMAKENLKSIKEDKKVTKPDDKKETTKVKESEKEAGDLEVPLEDMDEDELLELAAEMEIPKKEIKKAQSNDTLMELIERYQNDDDEDDWDKDKNEEDPFDEMTKEDLRVFLKTNKVKFHSKATKEELVKLAQGVK